MSEISISTLKNGLRLHRIAVPGTRAVTILAAFDAGARTERPEENGMAHFLEHLVFKGGEKYPTYRDVNEAAESIGAVLNAYTSHDLVAFHITARAQSGLDAADLLTDFVARPKIDAGRARPRARRGGPGDRARRGPAGDARRAPHRRGGVRRSPAGAPRARARRAPARHLHPRRHPRLPRPPLVAGRGERRLPSATSRPSATTARWTSCSSASSPPPSPSPSTAAPAQEPRVLVRERDSNQSHLRMSYRPMVDVTIPSSEPP